MSTDINLSIVAAHDDLRRCTYVLTDGLAETEFFDFTRQQEHCRLLWLNSFKESRRLQKELDSAMKSIAELETKLYHARRLLDQECKARREAEEERDSIEKKMCTIREFEGGNSKPAGISEYVPEEAQIEIECRQIRTGSFLHNL